MTTKKVKIPFTFDEVLSASIAAFRINDGYVKQDDVQEGRYPNRVLVNEILENPLLITEEDRSKVDDIRRHYQGLIFTAMKRELDPFEKNMLDIACSETIYSTDAKTIGLICFMPKGYGDALKYKQANERIRMADGGNLGDIGNLVDVTVEVLTVSGPYQGIYGGPPRWNIVAITEKNQPVKFYYKSKFDIEKSIHIRGKIASKTNDGVSVLTYVKVVV